MNTIEIEEAKKTAAIEACSILHGIQGVKLVGLGTGSTVKKFIDVCLDYLKNKYIIASSQDTLLYSKIKGLTALDPLMVNHIDVYIDGADEVSINLDLVKGRGGALLREKTLAYLSSKRIYVVDYTKYTGRSYLYSKSIPVEIVPFTLNYVVKNIAKTGLFEPALRVGGGKDGPVVTDNNNYILDLKPLKPIEDPLNTHKLLKSIHGVVETGIFPAVELVDVVVVGYPGGARVYTK